jgi:hypothetical protein
LKNDVIVCQKADVIPQQLSEYFNWRKDDGNEKLGPGLALVFHDGAHKDEASVFADIFRTNLGLETEPEHSIEEMGNHLERGI